MTSAVQMAKLQMLTGPMPTNKWRFQGIAQ